MNRTYELMFIVRPDMADEDLEKLISNLESTVTASAGSIKSVDRMGKRRLAYVVRKFREGIYILLTIEGAGSVVHELERRLRVTEPVIKFLTVRIDEEQKRLDKIKKIREARRKAPPAPATEAGSDGKTNLAMSAFPGFTVLPGNGDGTFQPQLNYAAGSDPASVIYGDFDNNKKVDLAVVNSLSGDLTVLLNSCPTT